ncbi:DNA-binding transcriptional regulator, LacI/PurR family [Arthrobacter subterraneus]|uniref:DNA-binding transcriptional regulator, LacI/PurR family n=1 Tax=Arthrobacter subterraneus TaxID=335973 RepID=A0A1G8HB12_9MICC|nr:LacI family DNA-binding transcriptional regulator [Arthrobacter subterraneus]SDI03833.1 DNA-binding transcriptional regulator, LacI/PurR family [Arthrobacter subterraneus]
MTQPRRPTMADVAAEAGVSRALVSIVIRGAAGAGEATRARVLEAAERLGYRPDARARLLRSSRSRLLGVVFDITGPYHTELVGHLYPAARTRGYGITLSACGRAQSQHEAVHSLLDLGVEALIILAPETPDEDLARLPVPVVSVFRPATHPDVASVASDERAGVDLAMNHLLQLGHRRIAHVDGGDAVGAQPRRSAYLEFTSSRPGELEPPVVLSAGSELSDGREAGARLLEEARRPSAVLVFNDVCALGVLQALLTNGVPVPEEVSVVGYDDASLAALAHVPLTSVNQQGPDLAAAAVEAADAALAGEFRHVLIPPSLTVRASTGIPNTGDHMCEGAASH